MKAVLQRVSSCSIVADGVNRGEIKKGLLILLGVQSGDTEDEAIRLVNKILNMRIFEDDKGTMNLSVSDIDGGIAVVSNFTLCANVNSGRRPSFELSERPERAKEIYNIFCKNISDLIKKDFITGVFGADMQVRLENDGPVTIIIDTRE